MHYLVVTIHNIQNLWVSGLRPVSGIPKTRKQRFENLICFCPSFSHLRTETDQISETVSFQVFRKASD
jgi:hypothetical protein